MFFHTSNFLSHNQLYNVYTGDPIWLVVCEWQVIGIFVLFYSFKFHWTTLWLSWTQYYWACIVSWTTCMWMQTAYNVPTLWQPITYPPSDSPERTRILTAQKVRALSHYRTHELHTYTCLKYAKTLHEWGQLPPFHVSCGKLLVSATGVDHKPDYVLDSGSRWRQICVFGEGYSAVIALFHAHVREHNREVDSCDWFFWDNLSLHGLQKWSRRYSNQATHWNG